MSPRPPRLGRLRGCPGSWSFVLATRNAHKVAELAALLPGHTLSALPDEVVLPPETADDFAGTH